MVACSPARHVPPLALDAARHTAAGLSPQAHPVHGDYALRWTPRAIADTAEEAHGKPAAAASASESYAVTYWESFAVDGGLVTFCVRHWPSAPGCPASAPARYELSIRCRFNDNHFPTSIPALLWDVDGSTPFCWAPPRHLPATESSQQIDQTRKCVVSQFLPGQPGTWKLSLLWPRTSQTLQMQLGKSGVPRRLAVQIQMQDGLGLGHRIVHPTHGRSFQIPLRPQLDASDGVRFELKVPSGDAAVWTPELEEAKRELERESAQHKKREALLLDRECEARKVEMEVSQLPTAEMANDLERKLSQEISQRRRCQADLMDMRGRPCSFCFIRGVGESSPAVTRRSRTEVAVASGGQSFEFDYVAEAAIAIEEAWAEVVLVLDLALHHPGSNACVFLCGARSEQAGTRPEVADFQRALVARMVDHMLDSSAEAVNGQQPAVSCSASAAGVGQDSSSFLDLLHDTETVVQDLGVLSPCARDEVLAAHDKGAASSKCDFTVISICADRLDAHTKDAASAGRLTIVNLHSVPDCFSGSGAAMEAEASPTATSSSGTSATPTPTSRGSCASEGTGVKKDITTAAKVAQACLQRTCEASGSRDAGQAKLLILTCVSQRNCDAAESLATLQTAASASRIQERSTAKAEESQCRRQLARALQENSRLRSELNERGRVVHDASVAEGEAVLDEGLSPSARHGCGGRSPRRGNASSLQSSSSEKRSRLPSLKENRMPENPRRAFSTAMLPIR
mmetsp:Transcript_30076/g.55055  ORF Transcript_30076/g.55055 Transcript_30076/m.55055 type:complete len:741 (-) Transcript_30076:57-2279(-)